MSHGPLLLGVDGIPVLAVVAYGMYITNNGFDFGAVPVVASKSSFGPVSENSAAGADGTRSLPRFTSAKRTVSTCVPVVPAARSARPRAMNGSSEVA